MERSERRRIVEALILGSPEPISAQRIADIIPYLKPAGARELVQELDAEYLKQGRSFEIAEVAGGYQLRTLPEFAPYLQQTLKTRALRLSQAALETLAVVAYRQPVTRAEVEHIRGVDAGAVMRSLIERKLVRIAGHRDVPGRPMLYGTSKRFLEVFELSRLEDLPTLRDLQELAPEGAVAAGPDPEATAAIAALAAAGDAGGDLPESESAVAIDAPAPNEELDDAGEGQPASSE
ncbi:MAG: SMC-Scp complex subunit ScpB [Deltaproteobacteria bacterium]|nr:SMC-Scp complex subunit ScpB [Deltaproteobacteria bacterium]MBW2362223.1 SMC-Scp complex subunit ScpB [Deltaproteobacteria bacterium]